MAELTPCTFTPGKLHLAAWIKMGLWLSRVALGSKFIILWPLVPTRSLKSFPVVLKKNMLNRLTEALLKLTRVPLPHSSCSYLSK